MHLSLIYFKLLGISDFLTKELSFPLSAGLTDLKMQSVQKGVHNHPSSQSDKGLSVCELTRSTGTLPAFLRTRMTPPALYRSGLSCQLRHRQSIICLIQLKARFERSGFYDYEYNEPTRHAVGESDLMEDTNSLYQLMEMNTGAAYITIQSIVIKSSLLFMHPGISLFRVIQ